MTELEVVAIVLRRRQVDEELCRLRAFEGMWSRWPGLNGRPTVYEGEFTHGNYTNSHDVSTKGKLEEVDPHASSRILAHEPDRVALKLLEASAGWLDRRDPVQLRRALLALLSALDE
ncbi:MAG: hypothetical protein E6J90_27170 [Deltaproteobacteria bacterium]|nr:MAG: hypothetical protein E6J90_27170 [Deltaproteobacteria bacterium]TMQ17296.1 MAG: hypothetical protein E6J91_10460 [Deltaproteobacteria bacterium]